MSVTLYTDFESEYEPEDRVKVYDKLGGVPGCSFDFEIRRSRSDDACDILESFVKERLRGLAFVVDDMFRLLSSEKLAHIDDFLDVYRYEKTKQNKALL